MCLWTKRKNTKTTKQIIKYKNPYKNPGLLALKADALPSPPSQLRVLIVVKLFNCFDAMDRNVNLKKPICGPHIFKKFIFL